MTTVIRPDCVDIFRNCRHVEYVSNGQTMRDVHVFVPSLVTKSCTTRPPAENDKTVLAVFESASFYVFSALRVNVRKSHK